MSHKMIYNVVYLAENINNELYHMINNNTYMTEYKYLELLF